MLEAPWSKGLLNDARAQGDKLADKYAKLILDPPDPQEVLKGIEELKSKQDEILKDVSKAVEEGGPAVETFLEPQSALWAEAKRNRALAGTRKIRQALKFAATAMEMGLGTLRVGEGEGAVLCLALASGALDKARGWAEAAQTDDSDWISGDERRQAYNRLIVICNKLIRSPELLMSRSSEVTKELEIYPPAIIDYFAPIECPSWVDEEKLRRASRVWDDNMLTILFVLYGASLPYCYIIERGIPLLYKTGKLSKKRNLFQRVYETGLMLDGAMAQGGLEVVWDLPGGFWEQLVEANETSRHAQDEEQAGTSDSAAAKDSANTRVADDTKSSGQGGNSDAAPKRLLYGRGLIHARKVRLLHASMRYMALNPGSVSKNADDDPSSRFSPTEKYDVENDGCPINQEDMAYTLLTFGYVIPMGLERWGCRLSREDKEAFLHAWKIVGYIMGIREDLLTDDWEQAQALFLTVKKRQGRGCEEGVKLTDALCKFLKFYLPSWGNLNTSLPPLIIKDQVGSEVAEMILSDKQQRKAKRLFPRLVWAFARFGLWAYFLIKHFLFKRSPTFRSLFGGAIHQAGMAFYESWRGPFDREAFFIPKDLSSGWVEKAGADEAFREKLLDWRKRMFKVVVAGLGSMMFASVSIIAGLVTWIFWGPWAPVIGGGLGGLAFVFSFVAMTHILKRVANDRPTLGPDAAAARR